jgi:hypothetical protein
MWGTWVACLETGRAPRAVQRLLAMKRHEPDIRASDKFSFMTLFISNQNHSDSILGVSKRALQ